MKSPRITSFRGLNNVADPLALDLSWALRADDFIINAQGKLMRSPGYASAHANTANHGAYVLRDGSRAFEVDNGELREVLPDFTTRLLASGLAARPFYFEEVADTVYYANGVDLGVITPSGRREWGIDIPAAPTQVSLGAGVLAAGLYCIACTFEAPDGRESALGDLSEITAPANSQITIAGIPTRSGYATNVYVTTANGTVWYALERNVGAGTSYNVPPAALGEEAEWLTENAPHGSIPAFAHGRMHLAETSPDGTRTEIWRSKEGIYDVFDDGAESVAVPGTARMLAGIASHLIIGTERAIYALDADDGQVELAPYGVPPGFHWWRHTDGKLYFWSDRGLCTAMPFANLTEDTVSVAPGASVAGTLIEHNGFRRYLVALRQGGAAYNART